MPYLRPPPFLRRVIDPMAMRFGFGGARTLTVSGRRTGRSQRVPVIPVTYTGARYLVAPRGETDWVRNLRASGQGSLGDRHGSEQFQATEVPAADRPPIIAAYRAVAGRAVKSQFETLPDAADHPVFRIDRS
jgi:deazaflavin-dependent oxidoreductase (nitroreductase family)